MVFHIVTLFPDAFGSYLGESILKRAIEDKIIKVKFYNPRDFEKDPKWRIDQKPYGGGPGMVMRALPVIRAIEKAVGKYHPQPPLNLRGGRRSVSRVMGNMKKFKIIFMCPGGTQFNTEYAKSVVDKKYTDVIIVCGRYEGIDARVKKAFKMEDISVGPFVLTGGELPAMIIIDSVSRQIEGVLGDINSLEENRVSSHEVYTRPEVFEYKGKKYRVPKVLLSGNHKKIEEWKRRRE